MSEHDPKLSRLYQRGSQDTPSAELDRAIRQQAHEAVARKSPLRRPRWMMPAASAATLLIGVGILIQLAPEALREPMPTLSGPTLSGPTLSGPTLSGPEMRGPESTVTIATLLAPQSLTPQDNSASIDSLLFDSPPPPHEPAAATATELADMTALPQRTPEPVPQPKRKVTKQASAKAAKQPQREKMADAQATESARIEKAQRQRQQAAARQAEMEQARRKAERQQARLQALRETQQRALEQAAPGTEKRIARAAPMKPSAAPQQDEAQLDFLFTPSTRAMTIPQDEPAALGLSRTRSAPVEQIVIDPMHIERLTAFPLAELHKRLQQEPEEIWLAVIEALKHLERKSDAQTLDKQRQERWPDSD